MRLVLLFVRWENSSLNHYIKNLKEKLISFKFISCFKILTLKFLFYHKL